MDNSSNSTAILMIVQDIVENDLDEALDLNNSVFGFSQRYSNRDLWLEKMQKNGRIYTIKGKGFLAIYHRNNLDGSISEHIWLCGVVPSARSLGFLSILLKYAAEQMTLPSVTITTGPEYPVMQAWVERMHFIVVEQLSKNRFLYRASAEDLRAHLMS